MTARESGAVERAAQDVVQHGKSQAEAARSHGVSYSSLTRALRRRGVPLLGPNRTPTHPPSPEPFTQQPSQDSPLQHSMQALPPMVRNVVNANDTISMSRPTCSPAAVVNHARVPQAKARPQTVTPLLRFIRELNEYPLELESFVSSLERPSGKRRTGVYLYQLAAQPHPNPTLRLAKAIVDQSRLYGAQFQIQSLTYEELLIGTADSEV